MDASFWLERWKQNQTGFHRADENPLLVQHWDSLGLGGQGGVLVPLCGKSRDLWWLRSLGHRVLGCELSPIAVESFFTEAGVTPERREEGAFHLSVTGDLTIYCGDFFDIDPQQFPPVRAVYDRAALIALPPEQRRRYANRLASLLPGGSRMLLITLEYLTGSMEGPPFSVPEGEVREFYGETFDIAILEECAPEPTREDFVTRGLHATRQTVYRLERRPP